MTNRRERVETMVNMKEVSHSLNSDRFTNQNSRKTSTSVSLTILKPLIVWIIKNWKTLKEMGVTDHLTCLLRYLYAGQETTVRTLFGTTDWFKIEKEVQQGCLLLPCLFNLYAEHIM